MSRAYEGLKSEKCELFCAQIAQIEPVSVHEGRSGCLVVVAAVLLGIAAFEGLRWAARRDVMEKRRGRLRRNVEYKFGNCLQGGGKGARRV